MSETPQEIVDRVFRENRRYTGDGLPGEPQNAPLPVGDPASGAHNPKKADMREALKAPIAAAAQSASEAAADADRAEVARDEAEDAADRAETAAAGVEFPVSYAPQILTPEQQAQARQNIGVASGSGELFKTVADLLNDNNSVIGYTGSGADFIVSPGDIITAQGFRYEVVASDAADEHVETAGGVKLRILPVKGFLPFAAFGPDMTDAALTVNSLSGMTDPIWIDEVVYPVLTPIEPWANMHLEGNRTGGFVIEAGEMDGQYLFDHTGDTGAPTPDITIKGLILDGLANYPGDETLGRQALSHYCGAARLINVCNTVIEDNIIRGFTLNGIYIDGVGWNNQTCKNKFFKAAYNGKVIAYYSSSLFSHRDAVICGNYSERNGPQKHIDASDIYATSSVDGIQVDDMDGAVIHDNTIKECSGVGIRVEGTKRFLVSNNVVDEVGQSGIAAYNISFDGIVTANTVRNWGKIPWPGAFVNYGGTIYVCRETPHISENPLPADPGSVDWFEVCPYSTEDVQNIPTYNPADYTLLPFRGYAGIMTAQGSYDIVARDNVITGTGAEDGSGKKLYACDFGLTPIHNNNNPISNQGLSCKYRENIVRGHRVARIYWPAFADPVAGRGPTAAQSLEVSMLRGVVAATITADSGTVTLNSSYNKLSWERINNLVHIKGQLRVSSISNPTGDFYINGLPFALANLEQSSEDPAFIIRPNNLVANPGVLVGTMAADQTRIIISRYNDATGSLTGGSASLASNSVLTIDGWYETS